ncbi:hypothetical protein PENTCL1PPCAC_15394, partial [Pristionchus entomophagus]
MFYITPQVVGTIAYSMMELSDNFRLFRKCKVALFNENVPENKEGFESLMRNMALSNCLSLIILFVDLFLNFIRKPAAGSSINISYQRSENRRILLTFLPIEISLIVCIFFTTLSLVVYGEVN